MKDFQENLITELREISKNLEKMSSELRVVAEEIAKTLVKPDIGGSHDFRLPQRLVTAARAWGGASPEGAPGMASGCGGPAHLSPDAIAMGAQNQGGASYNPYPSTREVSAGELPNPWVTLTSLEK